jgi:uncharacterized damage-inducible protein DinB
MRAEEQLLDMWEIHCRITLYLLDGVAAEAFGGESKVKGRSVAEQFAHIHNVRLMWLKASAPELLEGLDKIEKEQATDRHNLRHSLESSGQAIGALLKIGIESGKIKGFKPHPAAFMGYLIAHESYHHGEIGMILAQSGFPLDKKIAYGMWEWGSR